MRGLPISAGSLVGCRILSVLFALIVNAVAFFVPVFLLSDLSRELGTTSYVWFAGIWIGYALSTAGLWLLYELTLSGRAYTLIYFGFAASLMAVLALLEWTVDLSLVETTAELAQSYGAIPAISSTLAGGSVFARLSRITVRRLQKRDFSA